MTLGKTLRKKRKELKLTLRELGERCGVSASYMHDIELDRRTPSDEVICVDGKAVLFSDCKDFT